MGTNYYLHRNICIRCHRSDIIHIGKSSGGWVFVFYAAEIEDDYKLDTYEKWTNFLIAEVNIGSKIMNEYNEKVSLEVFLNLVAEKQCGKKHNFDGNFIDKGGYNFWDNEFS